MDTRYITSAAKPEQLPDFDLPELAFIGRSNTGKSSLLNALLGRRSLARHGRTPGQTQMINFFSVNDKVVLADLPGYGYNVARRDVAKHWQPMVDTYVRRPNITAFLCLHDCRRNFQELDERLMFMLGRQLPIILVLTKTDKATRNEIRKQKEKLKKRMDELGIDYQVIIETSATKNQGIAELKALVLDPHLQVEDENS
ncbi:ribosome biogenesis GTP-binding protein YihA/YsxC [Pseudobacteriovorax antillogorgiicola]|uniref:Probable GTP-binding protein EngB n=1 Tax=Pseudobacteriovorax antillogorgiicola TaxID=1513793 RepID=A0A1Y6B7H9_9BACT|nr:ribosome biogenesis GTP-binding protein YihA/YsxC [Pseudobacteriovorax antillogorgiicola]TCS58821.1 GTP-binding protein [Pseudobacteriovorax antillogorgiicola]SME94264.1 GTP-binding protein [Pseudobacteriovorax antillogorgiicola]